MMMKRTANQLAFLKTISVLICLKSAQMVIGLDQFVSLGTVISLIFNYKGLCA